MAKNIVSRAREHAVRIIDADGTESRYRVSINETPAGELTMAGDGSYLLRYGQHVYAFADVESAVAAIRAQSAAVKRGQPLSDIAPYDEAPATPEHSKTEDAMPEHTEHTPESAPAHTLDMASVPDGAILTADDFAPAESTPATPAETAETVKQSAAAPESTPAESTPGATDAPAAPARKRGKRARTAETASTPATPESAPSAPESDVYGVALHQPVQITSGKHAGKSGNVRCLYTDRASGKPIVVVNLAAPFTGRGIVCVAPAHVEATGAAPERPARAPRTPRDPNAPRASRQPRALALADVIAFLKAADSETLAALALEITAAQRAAETAESTPAAA